MKTRLSLVIFLLLFIICNSWAQDLLLPFSFNSERVMLTERSDFSKYINGKYLGHVYRESRLTLMYKNDSGIETYNGEAIVLEETLRDERAVARAVDDFLPVAFSVEKGITKYTQDNGYPILRGIPASPKQAVKVGQKWTGDAVVVVHPKSDSKSTRIPVYVEYSFVGNTKYNGQDAYALKAQFGVRYKGNDKNGDLNMKSSEGSRKLDIVLDKESGSPLFIREVIDETYFYNSENIRAKGFILHFFRGSVSSDSDLLAKISDSNKNPNGTNPQQDPFTTSSDNKISLSPRPTDKNDNTSSDISSPKPDEIITSLSDNPSQNKPGSAFEIEKTDRGIVLLLYDLRFVADGYELLPTEKSRLDIIADALKKVPNQNFLVEGHTADVGKKEGQYQLSLERAKYIIKELSKRGIPENRFVYKGFGGDKPIAPNDTEQNRARNRRVEITVLY